ncbi:alginate O-acetyltransferase complex protein AlgJ [Paraburkholderia sp. HC6.4b]|uniref:alginate O-acetyltransferase AlgX-related protein n=1 Tax=unclassified Paraburkholderia TaxID=2615204 RepID=UPI0016153FFF|nr:MULTISPECIES: cell division protein FtsQ [unclassified Paraburkholderia]MBB5412659.1 alginate O-acetyltransferase complex protein AlgJ [Paraburkholderia sp. HC6.4b]MBB5454737.1 alginate O-acetyltransferase complex protein AlgJ [Paraburkholderia sp. Kb1A]
MEDPKPLPQLPASRASKIAAVILMIFLFAGLLSNLRLASTTESVLPHAVTRAGILDGAVSKELANRMADTPIAADAARAQRALGWLTLHDLGPRVRQGCPGWLFLRDELSVYADSDSHLATRADTVAAVQRELARHGIALLVVVVPDKSRIEPQHLCSLYRPVSLGARLADWTSRLTADGVQVLDLSAALRGAPGGAFFRTDTHWTEDGAGAAAQAVAQRIRAMGVPLGSSKPDYRVTDKPPGRRPGDLVRLAGLDDLPPSWQPRPEIAASRDYIPQAQAAASADDLFGDADLPGIAVIGTSYSTTSDFVPQLALALGTGVGNFAREGGKFGGSARAYFASLAYAQTPPRLVVWELDERDLQSPLEAEDTVVVPKSSAIDSRTPHVEASTL